MIRGHDNDAKITPVAVIHTQLPKSQSLLKIGIEIMETKMSAIINYDCIEKLFQCLEYNNEHFFNLLILNLLIMLITLVYCASPG